MSEMKPIPGPAREMQARDKVALLIGHLTIQTEELRGSLAAAERRIAELEAENEKLKAENKVKKPKDAG